MSTYTISSVLDSQRVFILQKSKLDKRFDPFYYSPLNQLEIIEKTKLSKRKLSDIAELRRGRFSQRPRNDERFYGGKYPFIQTGDIVKAANTLGKIEYTQTLNELGLSVSKLFEEEVLLITIAANIGDTAILDYPACFPDSIVAIKSKDVKVNLRFLNVYFKFLKKYLENLAPQAAQKNLTLEQLAPTPIVIPTIVNQNRIVNIFDNYIEQKRRLEVEAKKLLASIDSYILSELGIILPELSENTLKNRMFKRTLKDITNNRFDPFFHQEYFGIIFTSIYNSSFSVHPLKNAILNIVKGVEVGSSAYVSEGIPFVRVADITDFSINVKDAEKKIRKSKYEELKELYKPQHGEILYSKDGTIGFCVIVEKEEEYILSSGILRIICHHKIDNYYLNYLLSTNLYKRLADRVSIGTVIKHLTIENWLDIPIPVPPFERQKEIAKHITNVRQQALQLYDQTKQELYKATKEIENILLK
ncbi:MAG: restriction endonuclease subunit S [Bacteroidia bacterium]|nr:restriction endonuclease subunit S [Bacteroidia bacterium]